MLSCFDNLSGILLITKKGLNIFPNPNFWWGAGNCFDVVSIQYVYYH